MCHFWRFEGRLEPAPHSTIALQHAHQAAEMPEF
jgi:hypothetical protein